MIVKIHNAGGGAWIAETRDGSISHNCAADYFPAAAISATPNVGGAVFWTTEMNVEMGELVFGAASTEEAFNAS